MRLYIDLDSRQLIQSPAYKQPITRLEFKRGDSASIEVRFVRGASIVELAEGAAGRLGFKAKGQYDADFLVSALEWTKEGTGAEAVYRFDPDFNTVELNTALGHNPPTAGNDLPSITLMGEIEWVEDGRRSSTSTFDAVVFNDVVKGTEGVPLSGNPAYPAPDAIELVARKGAADGYAPLDADARLPLDKLPAHGHEAGEISVPEIDIGTSPNWNPGTVQGALVEVFGWRTSEAAQLSDHDGRLGTVESGKLNKAGAAQTVSSPLHLTDDLTLAGKTISGIGNLFFADSRPAVRGTGADVSDGVVPVFDGTSGERLRAHSPTAITNLAASPTNAEIATKLNQLLGALRSLGIIA
jgi:hypothetical protein